jgi:FtsZ-interacting cell division protein ZipA
MDPNQIIISWKKFGPGMREGLVVIGTMLLVILLPFIWAVFWRKRGRRKHHHHHSPAGSHASHRETASVVNDDETPAEKKKRRRRRREHRPRNPTLSEAGGLPPIKREEDLGSSP